MPLNAALATLASVSGICHFNLRAHRELLEELRVFYTEVVGLSVGFRPAFRSNGYWLYAGSKNVLHLTEAHASESIQVGSMTTFNHIAFASSRPDSYTQRLQSRCISFETDTVPETGQIQLFFKDPAGNGVELNFSGS